MCPTCHDTGYVPVETISEGFDAVSIQQEPCPECLLGNQIARADEALSKATRP